MKRQWAYSLVASSLLLSAPLTLNAREPKTPNPCRQLEKQLDDQVNTLHKRQDAELAQCRQSNGKNAGVCRAMKDNQKLDLQTLRGQRQDEMGRCRGPLRAVRSLPGQRENESCDVYNRNRDRYARHKYPPGKEPPYKEPPPKGPPKNPPVGHNLPNHDGDGKHHHDQDASATRNAGNSGSGSSHSGGSSNGHSGSSSGSGSSGSSSYHGASSQGSSGSSSSSSSGSSGGSHSGSSGSSGGSSSSSSSSSASHESGSRPK